MTRLAIALTLMLAGSGLLHAQSRFEVTEADILQTQAALRSGQVTSVELVQKYLARIAAYDRQGPALNSLVRINPRALQIAVALDNERRHAGPRGPLHGIPVIIKDNYNTTDMPTTGSSVALAGFIPSANATQVERLVKAGAIVLAKSNLHEFAYGITSIGSLAGQTRNPYDPRRVPGGSSGGTGAAVAASFAAVGMGSDTCGSIRIPAAFNNLSGLRPSKGLSSIYGVMPLSHTQDVAGPLTRSVTDLALVLDAVAGYDPRDYATSIMANRPAPGFFEHLDDAALQGLRLGRLSDYQNRADSTVAAVINSLLEKLSAAGAEIIDVEIPELDSLVAASGLIGFEFRNDLESYFASFGSSEITRLADIVDAGLFHVAVQGALTRSRDVGFDEQAYLEAQMARSALRMLLEETLAEQQLDALLYPPIGQLPVAVGESQPGNNCSLSANSGLPAISIPAGFSGQGLPVGMELLGSFMSDTRLVSIAYQVEKLTDARRVPLATPPLVNGRVPEPLQARWEFRQSGVSAVAKFSYDQSRRELRYQADNTSLRLESLHTIALAIDEPPVGNLNDPLIATLLGPELESGGGELFVGPALHQALLEGRVYVRLFAQSLPASGTSFRLSFSSPTTVITQP